MTKEEGAIIMAYTGVVFGSMSYFHKYAEKIMGRPIFTLEFCCEKLMEEIKEKSRKDFESIHYSLVEE